ncbi:GNAT family N-acetyltransferase [Cellulophaga sp. F20128]|uniref:GNAT family N-acetyltransferase n=1 Tax=Cellulophaga sp. F20128 TaxID=2926413 RepID=UPI001FF43F5F|nr:GNAT family N-acetyltransferase [Cellulophaga sp. F20128]MCK0156865.1 GNAT family N-acetyltransferase [Cellulophaga sp. F20128]
MIKNNPFLNTLFAKTWLAHFSPTTKEYSFSLFPEISFLKSKWLPLFVNLGKTNTKGINYTLANEDNNLLKNKTFLIYDVHTYFNTVEAGTKTQLKLKKITQYPGYLCELENFSSVAAYMKKNLSKNSNYKFNLYKRKLEHCFDISYTMYYGAIPKETYTHLFTVFHQLLVKRFAEKQESNNNLDTTEWDFYFDVTYPMILEKKAALFVTYNKEIPIAITLLNFSDSIAFDTIRVFDTDYAPFRLGTISIIEQLQWCIENGIKYLDFSKGHYEYKERWATTKYNFEYHILYDSKGGISRLIAHTILSYFRLKNYLREKNINTVFHKFTFLLKNKKNNVTLKKKADLLDTTNRPLATYLKPIDMDTKENAALLKFTYQFMYNTSEKLTDIQLYEITNKANCFYIEGLENGYTFVA